MLLVSFHTVKAVLSQPGGWPNWCALLGDRRHGYDVASGVAPPRRRTNAVSKHAALLLVGKRLERWISVRLDLPGL